MTFTTKQKIYYNQINSPKFIVFKNRMAARLEQLYNNVAISVCRLRNHSQIAIVYKIWKKSDILFQGIEIKVNKGLKKVKVCIQFNIDNEEI